MSYLKRTLLLIILVIISSNAYSENALLSYTQIKATNKLEFKWTFEQSV